MTTTATTTTTITTTNNNNYHEYDNTINDSNNIDARPSGEHGDGAAYAHGSRPGRLSFSLLSLSLVVLLLGT